MSGLSDNMRGAVLMMAAMAFYTVNDAFLKSLGGSLSVWQALFLRGMAVTVAMTALALVRGELTLRVSARDRTIMLARAACETAAAILFVSALYHLPIANLSAILQALPLTVTLAGVLFLGERLGWRRSLAIAAGLGGVLLIVRPGAEGFTVHALLGVGAVVCVTARDILSRMMSPAVPSLVVAVVSSAGVTVGAGVGLMFGDWAPVHLPEALRLGAAATAIFGGYICGVAAMRVGDLAFVAPFRYTSLVVALLVGLVAFGEWPDGLTLVGAAIVVATGIYTFLRERRLAALKVA